MNKWMTESWVPSAEMMFGQAGAKQTKKEKILNLNPRPFFKKKNPLTIRHESWIIFKIDHYTVHSKSCTICGNAVRFPQKGMNWKKDRRSQLMTGPWDTERHRVYKLLRRLQNIVSYLCCSMHAYSFSRDVCSIFFRKRENNFSTLYLGSPQCCMNSEIC